MDATTCIQRNIADIDILLKVTPLYWPYLRLKFLEDLEQNIYFHNIYFFIKTRLEFYEIIFKFIVIFKSCHYESTKCIPRLT